MRTTDSPCNRNLRFATALTIVGGLLAPATVHAVSVTPTDLDGIELGEIIVGPNGPTPTDTLESSTGETFGELTSSVFNNDGLFTFTHTVTPGVPERFPGIDSFSTGFGVLGFTGVAGYDFAEATAAGVPVFVDLSDETGELSWFAASEGATLFNNGESITFFWQSTVGPAGPIGVYESVSVRGFVDDDGDFRFEAETAAAMGPGQVRPLEVIPTPAALPAGLAVLGGLLFRRRREVHRANA